jgi:hypothetical protein
MEEQKNIYGTLILPPLESLFCFDGPVVYEGFRDIKKSPNTQQKIIVTSTNKAIGKLSLLYGPEAGEIVGLELPFKEKGSKYLTMRAPKYYRLAVLDFIRRGCILKKILKRMKKERIK